MRDETNTYEVRSAVSAAKLAFARSPAVYFAMHGVAVLTAVCRRWRASLSLIDAQVASITCASQALISESVIAPDRYGTQTNCASVGTTVCAANCTVKSEPISGLLKPHWSVVERRRQVSTG